MEPNSVDTNILKALQEFADKHNVALDDLCQTWLAHHQPELSNTSPQQPLLDAIFNFAEDGIFVINEQGYYINANPSACHIVGYTHDELCQMHIKDLRFPEEHPGVMPRLNAMKEAGGVHIPELKLRHKNGSVVWVSLNVSTMQIGDQNLLLGISRDISHQKETETALRESEARYRTLFERATDAILIVNVQTLQIVDSNEQAYLHLGFRREEIMQEPIYSVIAETDYQRFQKHLERVIMHGYFSEEIRLHMKNNNSRYALVSTRSISLDGQNHFLIMWRDITEIKQIEDSLYFTSQQGWKESDENFINSLTIHLSEKLNVDYVFIGELIEPERQFIHSVAMAHGDKLIDNITYELADTPCENVIDKALCCYPNNVQNLFPKDLDLKYLDIEGYMGMPLWRSNGDPIGIIVLMHSQPLVNIALSEKVLRVVAVRAAHELEQQQAKLALQKSEALYSSVIRSMAEGIVVHQPDGRIIDANIQAERVLGLTYDQLIGRDSIDPRWHTIHEDGSPFPGETHPAVVTLQTGDPQHNVMMGVYKPDGGLSWISINSEPLTLSDGQQQGVVASFNDVTSLREAQEKQRQAELMGLEYEKQEELNELRSRVISLISHEFRTPMTVIVTSTSLLRMKVDILEKEELLKRLQKIDKQVTILNNMVDQVTAVNKSSYGAYQIQLIRVNIQEFFTNILNEINIVFEKHAPISLTLDTSQKSYLLDENLLHQISWNLISNAVKYTPQDGHITLICQCIDQQLTLNVRDTGIGIPEEDQAHLYDTFYRAHNVGSISGTGLGLAIVKHACQTLDGHIEFTTEVGSGTEFIVEIPLDG